MEGLYGDEWEEHLKHENMPREDYQVMGNFFFKFIKIRKKKKNKLKWVYFSGGDRSDSSATQTGTLTQTRRGSIISAMKGKASSLTPFLKSGSVSGSQGGSSNFDSSRS